MTRRRFWVAAVSVGLGLTFTIGPALAAGPFFEGKTVRIIVGYPPGGGYDTYARVVARHMGKHIPGKPTVIVENMPGAGGMISANYLYKIAKPDGLSIATFSGGHFFSHVMGQPGVEFDARKFEYIGAPVTAGVVCVLMKGSGLGSLDAWTTSGKLLRFGGTGKGSYATENVPRVLKAALGLPIEIVSGYKGISDIRLAAQSGEVDGVFSSWSGVKVSWRSDFTARDAVVVLQTVPRPYKELPKVPRAIDLAKTDEARRLIEAGIHGPGEFAWPFVLPPNTPKDRLLALRKAFEDLPLEPRLPAVDGEEFGAILRKEQNLQGIAFGDRLDLGGVRYRRDKRSQQPKTDNNQRASHFFCPRKYQLKRTRVSYHYFVVKNVGRRPRTRGPRPARRGGRPRPRSRRAAAACAAPGAGPAS
jgi:tripartite-type tricarboxylate transporter receptor subunit TctC